MKAADSGRHETTEIRPRYPPSSHDVRSSLLISREIDKLACDLMLFLLCLSSLFVKGVAAASSGRHGICKSRWCERLFVSQETDYEWPVFVGQKLGAFGWNIKFPARRPTNIRPLAVVIPLKDNAQRVRVRDSV